MKIVFNHYYRLRHDIKRSYILAPNNIPQNKKVEIDNGWVSRIHPIYAMIFSFLSLPIEVEDAIEKISYFLDIESSVVEKLLSLLINNEEPCHADYESYKNGFPRNIIIHEDFAFAEPQIYTPELFVFEELDFNCNRLFKAPLTLVFMVNNQCVTNCVYCYADKITKSKDISFSKIKKMIEEARSLNIKDFMIIGGELFLYREWRKLLDLLISQQYIPDLLSTKVPISEDDIRYLQGKNIPIQISIDSLNPIELNKILNVNEKYSDSLKNTLQNLERYRIEFQVATVLTIYNESTETLEELFTYLSNFKHLRRWEVRVAFKSLYSKKDFDEIKLSRKKINEIEHWVKEKQKNTSMNILWSPDDNETYFKEKGGSQNFSGPFCSGNNTNLVILPDGKVTICEQLYWDPRFIVGDINNQTIEEIWTSEAALNFSKPSKKIINKTSVCKSCELFDSCFTNSNRCIPNILKVYGMKNWDYPDPRCEKAPQFIYDVTHS
jgi:radical SAM protein with 4Fe4S-binding SPASM domain